MGIIISYKVIGLQQLVKMLNSKRTIASPLGTGISKITLYYEGLVKRATPVITGRLRNSITHEISPERASVGTNVQYARFVEFGHRQQPGRYVPQIGKRLVKSRVEGVHVEGGARVKGIGMFEYAWGQLLTWLGKEQHNIHREIDKGIKKELR